ncbi:hypothetical protein XELAEV_18023381mg [Xenopus laevis]|uniref:Uncharacterized protein n=1 Tax=Xenopus laevis TaxID=8355 RepID=A0A974HP17_XENLA|nr:hypothetical protein XELAEV_18023381mg [Xenopus laevis]
MQVVPIMGCSGRVSPLSELLNNQGRSWTLCRLKFALKVPPAAFLLPLVLSGVLLSEGHVVPHASERRNKSARAPVVISAGYAYCGVCGRITNPAEAAFHSPAVLGFGSRHRDRRPPGGLSVTHERLISASHRRRNCCWTPEYATSRSPAVCPLRLHFHCS